jgi:hypothetical protein
MIFQIEYKDSLAYFPLKNELNTLVVQIVVV